MHMVARRPTELDESTSRALDEREHAARHEAGAAHRLSGAGHLDDLDDTAPGADLDPPPGARGRDLIRLRAVVRGDDDLHAVAFHDNEPSASAQAISLAI